MNETQATREADLAIHARWIVPVDPPGVLEHHALVVDRGRIVALVPSSGVAASWSPRETITLHSHLLMPGLVNAHAHSAMALMRGVADDLPLRTWLEKHIWPREAVHVSPEFVRDGTLVACAEMLAGGITCCNDMYFYPDAAARAYEETGLRAMLGMPVLDFPTAYAPDADGYLREGLAARDRHKHSPRLSFSLAPHAPYTVGDGSFAKVVTYARQLDLPIQTHLQETRSERDDALASTGATPLARLDRLGATGPAFIAIHAVHPGPGDAAILARQGCHVVHCPGSNMKLASGAAPVDAYLAAGINVALGTDSAASNNRLDLFAEMRLASLLAKVTSGDAAALPAATALRMATLNGAKALGLDGRIGSLAPGKDADVVAVDLSAVELAPCYDPVSHLVHAAGREHVTDVWIQGERLFAQRALTRLDAAAIAARAALWRDRIA
ncbi:5-methylthioadenosine/S-adenosylhomocysteine deaminase [Burkholderiales bacterium]|nr:5-methylthioadenosine/S-adenosylhomocysteine deaminase [Burkholderiales bacterium]